jgi:hypothetical protein
MPLLFSAALSKNNLHSKKRAEKSMEYAKINMLAKNALEGYAVQPHKSIPISSILSYVRQQVGKAGLPKSLITRQRVGRLLEEMSDLYARVTTDKDWKPQNGLSYVKLKPTPFQSKTQVYDSQKSLKNIRKTSGLEFVRRWLERYQPDKKVFTVKEVLPLIKTDILVSGSSKPITAQTVHAALKQQTDLFERVSDLQEKTTRYKRKP